MKNIKLDGRIFVIWDLITHSSKQYEIESYKLYDFIQLKKYPSKTYLLNKKEWEALLEGRLAWIHENEVYLI